jgi:nitrite reductase (NADH) small subunit
MTAISSLQDKIDQGAQDAGSYFHYMAEFIGFDQQQADAVFESRFIIEKYIPEIVGQFYIHLLRYPPTRRFFLKPDGSIDQDYVQMRMQHLTNFWRRTASGPYDDDYARYVDYVGRAHTKRGADPKIDIAERYVIGQVGFIQHAISEALSKELREIDPDWEMRALRGWNLLMMVILELLSRVYHEEEKPDLHPPSEAFDPTAIYTLAVNAYENGLGVDKIKAVKQAFFIASEDEIPLGERKLVKLLGRPIGVFHHSSGWYAIKNKCLHAGGPVAEGELEGDILTCPWHGFQYNLPTGSLVKDPNGKLEMYPVEIHDGQVFITLPVMSEP